MLKGPYYSDIHKWVNSCIHDDLKIELELI